MEYRELLAAIGRMTGLDAGPARAAAEATLTTLARTLEDEDRQRLIEALPPELTDDFPMDHPRSDGTEEGFVRQAALLGHRPPEQARLRAQAVLAAVAEQDPELVARLHIPEQVRGLFRPPESGGGITGPKGHSAPLTAEEIRSALRVLPQWSGDRHALRRVVSLPVENLRAIRHALEKLKLTYGRAPHLEDTADGLEIVVCTTSADAVTALDVELATRVDEVIEEMGAGIAGPS
ncbi:pterin-4a-carbinolamine dehydratase [Nonomuraea polychroma]|uniref:Putative pterin-4-alpha-carbinolamine dehydratase n=1 Tax=Nonomuraea polychroma TaxID=46176 RepID=A0A438MIZ5_9ACTN|nr:DUF2267 domain-containing protein [Nonomuraea polychroma]RVX45872.1 pterin-4a-carbinolamine dehydratase [Nonomuraea polychroma]